MKIHVYMLNQYNIFIKRSIELFRVKAPKHFISDLAEIYGLKFDGNIQYLCTFLFCIGKCLLITTMNENVMRR